MVTSSPAASGRSGSAPSARWSTRFVVHGRSALNASRPQPLPRGNRQGSVLALAANELLDAAVRFIVRHLHRRMLREIRGGGMQHAADPAIKRKFATADGVDGHTGGVR